MFDTAYRHSRLRGTLDRLDHLKQSVVPIYDQSRVATVADRLTTVIQASEAWVWLTSEPDTETIVVDLAETRTVGPVVRCLHRFRGRD